MTIEQLLEFGIINPTQQHNTVTKPKHYKQYGEFEPIKVIQAWNLDFELGNCLKYIARAGYKEDNTAIQDLEKAKEYIDLELEKLRRYANEA